MLQNPLVTLTIAISITPSSLSSVLCCHQCCSFCQNCQCHCHHQLLRFHVRYQSLMLAFLLFSQKMNQQNRALQRRERLLRKMRMMRMKEMLGNCLAASTGPSVTERTKHIWPHTSIPRSQLPPKVSFWIFVSFVVHTTLPRLVWISYNKTHCKNARAFTDI